MLIWLLNLALGIILWYLISNSSSEGDAFNQFGVKVCGLSTGYVPGSAELRYSRQTGGLFRVMQSWISADDGEISYAPVTRTELDEMIQERETKLEHLKTEYVTPPTQMINNVNRELHLLNEAKTYDSFY